MPAPARAGETVGDQSSRRLEKAAAFGAFVAEPLDRLGGEDDTGGERAEPFEERWSVGASGRLRTPDLRVPETRWRTVRVAAYRASQLPDRRCFSG